MVHHFDPIRYYSTMGFHEPALRVKDGDTVITSTVDARGKDRTDTPVTPPGRPAPFTSTAPNRAIRSPCTWTG